MIAGPDARLKIFGQFLLEFNYRNSRKRRKKRREEVREEERKEGRKEGREKGRMMWRNEIKGA